MYSVETVLRILNFDLFPGWLYVYDALSWSGQWQLGVAPSQPCDHEGKQLMLFYSVFIVFDGFFQS